MGRISVDISLVHAEVGDLKQVVNHPQGGRERVRNILKRKDNDELQSFGLKLAAQRVRYWMQCSL
jgi:hypothetical protein